MPQGHSLIRHKKAEGRISPRALYAVAAPLEKSEETTYNPDEISYRELTEKVRQELNVAPTVSDRSAEREITLADTWLDRVNAYRQTLNE